MIKKIQDGPLGVENDQRASTVARSCAKFRCPLGLRNGRGCWCVWKLVGVCLLFRPRSEPRELTARGSLFSAAPHRDLWKDAFSFPARATGSRINFD